MPDERVEDEHVSEDDYNEEEDEDFDPSKVAENANVSSEDDEEGDEYKVTKHDKAGKVIDYSHIENESGGLIKTRRARELEDELGRKQKYENLQQTPISDNVNDIWEAMKNESSERLATNRGANGSILSDFVEAGSTNLQQEQIMIERTYKFAGETIHEKKMVVKSSAEGQEYLKNLKFNGKESVVKERTTEINKKENYIPDREHLNLRRPLKRPPLLEQIISGAIKPKLTTLEKSKLDWVNYVDKEGITDELTIHNKDGYLAKQDFLDRVESNKDQKYKEFRKKQLEMQLQEQNQ